MKTLLILLTAVALITACEHKNEVSCNGGELTSNEKSECVCQLLTKKNQANEKMKRSKNGLIIISKKINSIN